MVNGSRTAGRVLLAATALVAGAAAPAQTIDEFAIPTPASRPTCIEPGPDGNLWFTETAASKIGRITPSGVITEFTVHANSGGSILDVRCIAPGPDGKLWFTTSGPPGGKIGKIATGGVVTLFPQVITAQLYAIARGPDDAMWFMEQRGLDNTLGRMTAAGALSEIPLPTPGFLIVAAGITAGPDGAIWFAQGGASRIGRIATDTLMLTEYPTPGFFPAGITSGPDGALWFTEGGASIGIGRMATGGEVTQFEIPSLPAEITTGPDGSLWITEGSKIVRMTAEGDVTEFAIPTAGASADGITAGPDGNIWFTENLGNKIGRLNLVPTDCGTGRAQARPLAPPDLACVDQRP
jgi:virginiamycin B lyase